MVSEKDRLRKQIQTVASIFALTALTVLGAWLFTTNFEFNKDGKYNMLIQYLNCVPIVENFCSNFHMGSKLEARPEY